MRFVTSSVDKGKLGSGIVDTKALVSCSDYVNLIWLAFGTFLIKICINRLVIGTVLQHYGHHLEEGFSQ